MAAVQYPFPIYLIDTSVVARRNKPPVRAALEELQRGTEFATCPLIAAEVCYSARNAAEFRRLRDFLATMIMLNCDDAIESAALEAQEKLAAKGMHRTPTVDLFVAAIAAAHGATVLHYDSDFERIGPAVGAKTQWVVPQ